MKKIFILCALMFATPLLASGIGVGATSATCDNSTLETYGGTANVEIDWQPNTINLSWYDGDTKLNVQSGAQTCNYDGSLTIPSNPPTRTGYTFAGWELKYAIPAEYTELQYIESTGTQWIDTEVSPQSENIIYQASWLETQLEVGSTLFGTANYDNSSGTWPGTLYHPSQGDTYLAIADSDGKCRQSNIVANQVNNIEIIINNGNLTKIQNGDTCTTTYDGTVQIGSNISLFRNQGVSYWYNRYEQCNYTRLFYWKMFDNGTLVREMIPAKRNSDNVVGMWDTVTQTFFTNAGTGSFTAGPTVQ